MSVTSVGGITSRQGLANSLSASDSISATFSLSTGTTEAATESGLSDSDLANAFQMMSVAMQSALIASQDRASAVAASSDSASLDASAGVLPPPPVAATSSVTAAESSESISEETIVETAAAVSGVAPLAEVGATGGLDPQTTALVADLDQVLTDLTASVATSAAATGTPPPAPGSLESILAKYQSGTRADSPSETSFASQLTQDITRAIGSYGQSSGSATSSGSISV